MQTQNQKDQIKEAIHYPFLTAAISFFMMLVVLSVSIRVLAQSREPSDQFINVRRTAPATVRPDDWLGAYEWDTEAPVAGDSDIVTAAERVAELGLHTFRFPLFPARQQTLLQTVMQPDVVRVLSEERLRTFIITLYSEADLAHPWLDGYSDEEAAAEAQEMAQLLNWLRAYYPDRVFLFANWEGDNALRGNWHRAADYARWINTRTAAIRAARNDGGRFYSVLEFNLVRPQMAGDHVIISELAAQLEYDFASYSAYQSSNAGTLQQDLPLILEQLRIPATRLIIGELAIYRELFSTEAAAESHLRQTLDELQQAGVRYVVLWQVYNSTPRGSTWLNDGLFDDQGQPTFRARVARSYTLTGWQR